MSFLPVLIQFFTVAVKDGQFTVFVNNALLAPRASKR